MGVRGRGALEMDLVAMAAEAGARAPGSAMSLQWAVTRLDSSGRCVAAVSIADPSGEALFSAVLFAAATVEAGPAVLCTHRVAADRTAVEFGLHMVEDDGGATRLVPAPAGLRCCCLVVGLGRG